jgi:hypothetical protein
MKYRQAQRINGTGDRTGGLNRAFKYLRVRFAVSNRLTIGRRGVARPRRAGVDINETNCIRAGSAAIARV